MFMKQTNIAKWLGSILLTVSLLSSTAVLASETADKQKPGQLPLKDVQRFTTAISQIKNYYVKPVDDKKLFEEAIRGMLAGLDPHSAYLDEDEFKDLHDSTKGEFSGLGIEVTMENGVIKVISPIDDTPAYKAGLKPGDFIVRLNDHPIKGMTLREAVKKMRGKKGTKINLLVIRKGEAKPLNFTVVRDKIQIKSVKSKLFEDHYAYIRISHFQSPTAKDMRTSLKELTNQAKNKKIKGLVLDLRNNPGGLLDSAVEISDAFIHNDQKGKEELIVYTEGRLPGSEFKAHATPGDILKGAPIVVLINEGSASGSEIVAGALKDHKRALLIGTKTFGKGSVQTVLPLDEKRGIKLTTALYYTPSGNSIQATGISPDIIIKSLEIPEEKNAPPEFLMLQEKDLDGHLANGSEKDKHKKVSKAKVAKDKSHSSKDLLHSDYQLYQALNLLKGLVLSQNRI